MTPFPNITLAILAGGKASRMNGRNKALLEIDGQTFIKRIHQSLSPIFSNTIIISNEVRDYSIQNTNVYPDIIQNIGPLGGIHSALVNSLDPIIFIVSCDMPFADPSIAATLADEFLKSNPEILVPLIISYKEPLFALYSKNLITQFDSIFTETTGRPITDLLDIANTLYYELPNNLATKRCFTNINSEDDFRGL